MKKEISGRKELEEMVNSFYERVRVDPLLAPMFVHVNWAKHLPTMYTFWENALFYTGGYSGNPLKTHTAFHQRKPLSDAQFDRWQELFIANVDAAFKGEKAELAKQRAVSIATVMRIKILHT